MNREFALPDSLAVTVEGRIDCDEGDITDEFAAPAKLARRRDLGPVGMDARDLFHRVIDGGGGTVNMAPLRTPAHLDALQQFRLKRRSITFKRFELAAAGGLFERCDGIDAEVLIQLADAVGLQAGDAQHFQHALGGFFAHRLQTGMLSCLVDFRDDGGERVADAGDLRQAFFGDELLQRERAQSQIIGGPGVGARTVRIAALQFHALGELAQDLRDGGGIGSGHKQ